MKKNIAILVPCLAFGGAERQISIIAPLLVQSGYAITVISMIPPRAYKEQLEQSGISVITLHMKQGHYSLNAFFQLIAILKKAKAQQLITFNYPANMMGRMVKSIFPNINLITSYRSSTFGSKKRELFLKLTNCFDYKTVPNSQRVAEEFLSKGIIEKSRLKVIRNGIIIPHTHYIENNIKSRSNSIRNAILSHQSDTFLWVAVGRYELPKDYPTLFKACSILKKTYTGSWHLAIVGDGRLREQSEEMIKSLQLESHISMLGKKADVLPYYYAADAYVSSSAWEGMPNALVEAMMTGLPCVSTAVGEVPNIISEGVTGITVPSKNEQVLAEAMQSIMEMDRCKRADMGKDAAAYVRATLDINKVISEWQLLLT